MTVSSLCSTDINNTTPNSTIDSPRIIKAAETAAATVSSALSTEAPVSARGSNFKDLLDMYIAEPYTGPSDAFKDF